MAHERIKGRYVGPGTVEVAGAGLVGYGDVHEVTEADLLSAHWQKAPPSAKLKSEGGES